MGEVNTPKIPATIIITIISTIIITYHYYLSLLLIIITYHYYLSLLLSLLMLIIMYTTN